MHGTLLRCLCSGLAGGSCDTPFAQSRKQLRQAWKTCPESAVRNEQTGTHISLTPDCSLSPRPQRTSSAQKSPQTNGISLASPLKNPACLASTHPALSSRPPPGGTPQTPPTTLHASGCLEHSQDSPKAKGSAGAHLLSSKPSFVSSSLHSSLGIEYPFIALASYCIKEQDQNGC